jgi:hypothetical protein
MQNDNVKIKNGYFLRFCLFGDVFSSVSAKGSKTNRPETHFLNFDFCILIFDIIRFKP